MEITKYLKSLIDEDKSPVVICDLEHRIIYMNPSACENYDKYGGIGLLGKNLLDCHNDKSKDMIARVIYWFKKSKSNNRVFTFHNEKQNKDVYMIALRDEEDELIGYYEKHEYRNKETMDLYDFN